MSNRRFFSKVQDLFLNKKHNVHAVRRHHHFRNPEEGASRPGFIHSAPQSQRPGFIAGYGNVSPETGSQILQESKSALGKISLGMVIIILFLYYQMR